MSHCRLRFRWLSAMRRCERTSHRLISDSGWLVNAAADNDYMRIGCRHQWTGTIVSWIMSCQPAASSYRAWLLRGHQLGALNYWYPLFFLFVFSIVQLWCQVEILYHISRNMKRNVLNYLTNSKKTMARWEGQTKHCLNELSQRNKEFAENEEDHS